MTTHHAHGVRIMETEAPITSRVLKACSMLGIGVRRTASPPLRALPEQAAWLLRSLAPGEHAHVVGESGSGKSTLLTRARAWLEGRGDACESVNPRRLLTRPLRTPIDWCEGSIEEAMSVLACAGLAEASLLVRPVRSLSEGERWRLALATAMRRASIAAASGTRTWIIADEFAGSLDDRTARWVCEASGKWAARAGISLLVAGVREQSGEWLGARGVMRASRRGELHDCACERREGPWNIR